MIAYLRGKIRSVGEDYIVVDARGLGYKVYVPMSIIEECAKLSGKISLHIHHHQTDRSSELYGFKNSTDLAVFEDVISVNGVGPKAAMSLLSMIGGSELKEAIIAQDEAVLCEAHGIGKGVAARICRELSEKLEERDAFEGLRPTRTLPSRQALEALKELGYNHIEAQAALRMVPKEVDDPQERLKEALKNLGK